MLLRLMLVDRGGSAAGRKARVEGIGEKMAVMKRRARERSIVFVWGGGEEKALDLLEVLQQPKWHGLE